MASSTTSRAARRAGNPRATPSSRVRHRSAAPAGAAASLDWSAASTGCSRSRLWAETTRRLLLGRDRLGIKPLFYAALDDAFVFASEIKALLQHPDVARVGQHRTRSRVPGFPIAGGLGDDVQGHPQDAAGRCHHGLAAGPRDPVAEVLVAPLARSGAGGTSGARRPRRSQVHAAARGRAPVDQRRPGRRLPERRRGLEPDYDVHPILPPRQPAAHLLGRVRRTRV